jgi:signal transduction histidine kinase
LKGEGMEEIKVSSISSLTDAVKYHNRILETTDTFQLDFQKSQFIRNNYLSIIGLALEKCNNKFEIIEPIDNGVCKAMRTNGFLSQFTEVSKRDDTHKTMIRYTQIPLNNHDEVVGDFYLYFNEQLKRKVLNTSDKLLNKIMQKIFELFSNVFRHSQSELGLFCSGQFYPKNEQFNFTIVDGGIGIPYNVNGYLKEEFKTNNGRLTLRRFEKKSDEESIDWAMKEGHSSTGKGGLGLALLEELILKSHGTLEIVSKQGHYRIKNGKKELKKLNDSFEGTVISIGLNTNIDNYYFLKGEKK